MRPYSQCLPASCASVQITVNSQLVLFVCFVYTWSICAAFLHPSSFHTTWLLSYPDSWLSSSSSVSLPLCNREVLWILCLVVFFFLFCAIVCDDFLQAHICEAHLYSSHCQGKNFSLDAPRRHRLAAGAPQLPIRQHLELKNSEEF